MHAANWLKPRVKIARRRGAAWVGAIDFARLLATPTGRSVLWTRAIHREDLHQTSPDTAMERYPELFDRAAALVPNARRVMSFGCSTGEELLSLRRRFPQAQIVGIEINPRSRAIARRLTVSDRKISVVPFLEQDGPFAVIFALAVFQREPHKIADMGTDDLSRHYPFSKFDAGIRRLVGQLAAGGLLCVDASHYRVEDSSVAWQLDPISGAPAASGYLFGRDGLRLHDGRASTCFRKRQASSDAVGQGGARDGGR